MSKSGQMRYKGWSCITLILLACGYSRMTDLNAFLHNCYKHGLLLIPLWNPVLRKVVLSKPWRHNGGEGVCLHSFLILAIKWRSEVNSTPWPLYPQGRIPYPLSKRLDGPTACLDILEKRRIVCLYWGPKPVSCSLQHSHYKSLFHSDRSVNKD